MLLLLTTNEELHRLHPAVIRPGRCLARIEFDRFPIHEARQWLSHDVAPCSEPPTLAELFELNGTVRRLGPASPSTEPGQYL